MVIFFTIVIISHARKQYGKRYIQRWIQEDLKSKMVVNAGERQIAYQHDLKFNALSGDLHGEIKTSSMHEEWNAIQNWPQPRPGLAFTSDADYLEEDTRRGRRP